MIFTNNRYYSYSNDIFLSHYANDKNAVFVIKRFCDKSTTKDIPLLNVPLVL